MMKITVTYRDLTFETVVDDNYEDLSFNTNYGSKIRSTASDDRSKLASVAESLRRNLQESGNVSTSTTDSAGIRERMNSVISRLTDVFKNEQTSSEEDQNSSNEINID